jgi:hypothetical protein
MPGSRRSLIQGVAGVGMGLIENDKAPARYRAAIEHKISCNLGGRTYLKRPADLSEHNPSRRVMRSYRGRSK